MCYTRLVCARVTKEWVCAHSFWFCPLCVLGNPSGGPFACCAKYLSRKVLSLLQEDVVKHAWQSLEGPIRQQGYELIEVEFGGPAGRRVLRLFIDSENGIGLDDCQTVTRLVDPILDAEDFIDSNYVLEVSSPGFDRPLRRPQDFQRFVGEPVKLKTHMPVNGRKRIKGFLKAFDSGMIIVESDGAEYSVHLENLRKANLDR